jgi:hypothetical protein
LDATLVASIETQRIEAARLTLAASLSGEPGNGSNT